MFWILFQKHLQLLAQHVGKIVRRLAQPFSLPLLSHNLIRRKCLTFRRSRPPAAAAELKALAPLKTNLFRPCFFKRYSVSQALFSAGFAVSPGFAWWRYAGLWSFWPLALVQQAQAAIILVVLRSLGGAALFRSSCPSPNPSYRFWFLALTFRSSRPAFCGRLTSPVSTKENQFI